CLPFHHFAPNGVVAVEAWLRRKRQEELGAVGVGPRVRHAQDAGLAVLAPTLELTRHAVARRTAAGAARTPALRHEAGDDAVEVETVVVAQARQVDAAGDMHGRGIGIVADLDRADGRLHVPEVVRVLAERQLRRLLQRQAPAWL